MKLCKKYPILGSSQDPEKLSLAIKSGGLAIIPTIIFVSSFFGINVLESDLTMVVNNIASIVLLGGLIWGVVRKYYNIVITKINK